MRLPKPVESFTFATVVVTLDAKSDQKHCKAAFDFVYLHSLLDAGKNWTHSLNVSTTPITVMGCRQCLPFSVVQLKGKHCQKPLL